MFLLTDAQLYNELEMNFSGVICAFHSGTTNQAQFFYSMRCSNNVHTHREQSRERETEDKKNLLSDTKAE